jgi:hydrogenase 3 maturation protease
MGVTVICGIGNRMRGDDAVGPLVTDKLRGKTDALLLDCGEAPESFLGKIEKAKPDRVIIVDAVEMDKPPGNIEAIDIQKIRGVVMSSHNIPMTLFLEYLQERIKCEIISLGIQPSSLGFNDKISDECGKAVDKAADEILKYLKKG